MKYFVAMATFSLEPSLIKNTVISFSTPQWATMGYILFLVWFGIPGTNFDHNKLKLFTS